MKIYDNLITWRREYYSDKGVFLAHMDARLLIERERKDIPRHLWPDGYDMRPWMDFPDKPND